MAEPPPKRRRDDDGDTQIEPTKRHRNPYINDQQEATQDLLDFLINLSSDPFLDFPQHPEPDPDDNDNNNNNNNNDNHLTSDSKEEVIDEDDEKERVIRHLLEASDDELGIPSRVDDGGDCGGNSGLGDGGGGGEVAGGGYGDFPVDLCYGLWEIEDEAANYYTLLQSELFMQ